MKSSFILHLDALSILNRMSDDMAGRFIKIIYEYQKTGVLPELDLALDMAITPFINQFERDNIKYNAIVDRNQGNGMKGGRPKKDNKEPKKPNGLIDNPKNLDNDNDNDSVSDNDSDNDSENEKENIVTISVYPFEKFWEDYDKKAGDKKKIKPKWDKLSEQTKILISEYIPKYKKAQPDKQYRKNPDTFLNNSGWLDEIIEKKVKSDINRYDNVSTEFKNQL